MDDVPPPEAFEPQPEDPAGTGRFRRRVQIGVTLTVVAALVALAAVEGGGYIMRGDAVSATPPPLPAPPARIAAVDAAGALTTFDPLGQGVVAYPVSGVAFQFPAWSPDGSRIAAIGMGPAGTGVYVFAARTAGQPAIEPIVVYQSAERPPFYLYWTPDGGQLTFLTTETNGLALRIVPVSVGATDTVVRLGAPMYWDVVDNGHLLVHSGTTGPDSFLGELALDGVAVDGTERSPGVFRVPATSADGAYRGYLATGDGTGEVVLESRSGGGTQRVRVFGPAALAFRPGGHQLAFLAPDLPNGGNLPFPVGPLRLMDPDVTGARTLIGGSVVAFFWSPTGKEIAILEVESPSNPVTQADTGTGAVLARADTGTGAGLARADTGTGAVLARADTGTGAGLARADTGTGAGLARADTGTGAGLARANLAAQEAVAGLSLRLAFIDAADGTIQSERDVRVSDLFVNQLLPYFDQYALSHRVWSPDGAAIVLPIVGVGDVTRLMEIAADGSAARAVATGDMGFWSP